VAEQFTETVDCRGFHFKISDPVLPEAEIGEAVDELRVSDSESKYATLGAIESGAGNGDALVKVFHEMFDQRCRCGADVRVAGLAVHLRMGYEGLDKLFLFLVLFVPVKVQEIVDAESVRGGYEAVDANIRLQRT